MNKVMTQFQLIVCFLELLSKFEHFSKQFVQIVIYNSTVLFFCFSIRNWAQASHSSI